MKVAALINVRSRVHYLKHWTGDQVPIVGQRDREHWLELKIYDIALRLVQPIGIFLEKERPCARNRIRELLVNRVERLVIRRLRKCTKHREQADESDQGYDSRVPIFQSKLRLLLRNLRGRHLMS